MISKLFENVMFMFTCDYVTYKTSEHRLSENYALILGEPHTISSNLRVGHWAVLYIPPTFILSTNTQNVHQGVSGSPNPNAPDQLKLSFYFRPAFKCILILSKTHFDGQLLAYSIVIVCRLKCPLVPSGDKQ